MKLRTLPSERGFTLIEAMIALVIIAFGLLALAGMQIMLSRNADVSKQRTEATRLAQERMEKMRSYTGISSDPAALDWQDLATEASDPLNPLTSTYSNTIFSRSWVVSGTADDAMRPVSVTVAWVDRAGERQSVTLTSVISNTDPTRVGALALPAVHSNLKQPKNRNINIPAVAQELDEGRKSAYQFRPDYAVVFNNTTGLVEERCDTLVTDATYSSGTAGCIPYKAAIVSGFVTGAVEPAGPLPPPPGTAASSPSGVNTDAVTGVDTSPGKAISCAYAVAKDQNTGANLVNAHYYLCVIPLPTTGGWSGVLRLTGIDTSVPNNFKVCRFVFAPSDLLDDNQRNDQPYDNVQKSLDNQNYFIDNSAGPDCVAPAGLTGATLTVHQDCRSGVATPANCPATATATPL